MWVFGKIADGSEDGAAVAFGSPAVTTQRAARIHSFSGWVSGSITDLVRGFAFLSHATDPQMPTVTTTRVGALAVAFVAQNDNNTMGDATGESGGNWTEAVAEYTVALTPGFTLQLQTTTPTSDPGTVSGGSVATTNDPCGVIAFEIRPFRTYDQTLTGDITPAGALVKSLSRVLTAAISSAGALLASIILKKDLSATYREDTFDGTGALSASWTLLDGGAERVSGVCVGDAGNNNGALWTGDPWSPDQYVEATVQDMAGNGLFLFARNDGNGLNGSGNTYMLLVNPDRLRIVRRLGSTFTDLTDTTGLTIGTGDKVAISVIGTVLTCYLNGVPIASAEDGNIASGTPGFSLTIDTETITQWKGLDTSVHPLGALLKQANKVLSGAIAIAGGLTAAITQQKSVDGTLTPTGLLQAPFQKPLTASIAIAGDLLRAWARAVTGTVASSATITFLRGKSFTATVQPAGDGTPGIDNLTHLTSRSLLAATASSGAMTKLINRSLLASIASAGALATILLRVVTLTATVASAGALVRLTQRLLAGSQAAAGTLSGQTSRALSGTIAIAGTLVKMPGKVLAGAIAIAGAITTQRSKVLAGQVQPAGDGTPGVDNLLNQVNKTLAASQGSAGVLAGALAKLLTGQLTPTGQLLTVIPKAVTGAIAIAGSLSNRLARALLSSVTIAGTLLKQPAKLLSGTVTPSGILTTISAIVKDLTGAVTSAGTLTKSLARLLLAQVASAGALTRASARSLQASMASAATLVRQVSVSRTGSIMPLGEVVFGKFVDVAGAVASAGQLAGHAAKALVGSITLSGLLGLFFDNDALPATEERIVSVLNLEARVVVVLSTEKTGSTVLSDDEAINTLLED